jgi:F-type H+-transporting ATPase subunit b
MPAFLELEFWNWSNPELWVAIGLVAFLAVLWFAGAFKTALVALDAKAEKIQTDLEEAARLRAEAEAMLADIRKQRAEAEHQGAEMLKQAQADARRLEIESKAKLEEQIARRTLMAKRRIANVEAQARAEVQAAAAELAAQMAESVFLSRLAGVTSDPMIDDAVGQIASKLS